ASLQGDVIRRIAAAQVDAEGIGKAETHVGDLVELHGAIAVPGDDQLAQSLDLVLAGEAHRVLAAADVGKARGTVHRALHRLRDAADGNAGRSGAVRVEGDLHLARAQRIELHAGNALNARQARLQHVLDHVLIGRIVKVGVGVVRLRTDLQGRDVLAVVAA